MAINSHFYTSSVLKFRLMLDNTLTVLSFFRSFPRIVFGIKKSLLCCFSYITVMPLTYHQKDVHF